MFRCRILSACNAEMHLWHLDWLIAFCFFFNVTVIKTESVAQGQRQPSQWKQATAAVCAQTEQKECSTDSSRDRVRLP